MGYMKALEILPTDLVTQIQQYVDGQIIYVPKIKANRCNWGEKTDTRDYFHKRNIELYNDYNNGVTLSKLSDKYFLAPKSIQRIIRNMKG